MISIIKSTVRLQWRFDGSECKRGLGKAEPLVAIHSQTAVSVSHRIASPCAATGVDF